MELETIVAIAEGSSTEIEEYYLQTDLRIKQIKEFLDDTVKNWDQYCIQLEKSGVNAETIHLIRNQQINPIRKIQDRLNIQAPNLFSTPQYNDTISMARNSLNKAKIEVKKFKTIKVEWLDYGLPILLCIFSVISAILVFLINGFETGILT